jgi:hypothetical protein
MTAANDSTEASLKDHLRFERDKACYDQQSESYRSLNSQMWQVPLLGMTLTGGLWFGITSSNVDDSASAWILSFCGICDFSLILIIWRVRIILELIITKLNEFNTDFAIVSEDAKTFPLFKIEKLVAWLFSFMLFLAGSLSLTAAWYISPW